MLMRKLRATLRGGTLLAGAGAVTVCGTGTLLIADAASGAGRQTPVRVCQATGDGSYVLVSVLPDRLTEYRSNPNNLVPAPAGGCPASVSAGSPAIPQATTPSVAPATPTLTPPSTPPAPAPTTTTAAASKASATAKKTTTPKRATTAATVTTPAPTTTTAATPATATPATATPAAATPAAATVAGSQADSPATSTASPDRLADTGSDSVLLTLFGADMILLGAGLRLRARRPS